MLIDLSGRTALITGSTAGIGFEIASVLHASGANIIFNGLTSKDVDAAIKRFDKNKRVRGVVADVGTLNGCQKIISSIPAVDILINNVGIFNAQPLFEIPDSEWERFFAVNVMSGVRLSRHYIPKMVTQGWGRTVFISSVAAIQIPPDRVHYGMTKTAQLAVARGFAEAVSSSGVTINSVIPGPTLSEGAETYIKQMFPDLSTEDASQKFIQKERPTSLLGRMTSVKEVANMVVYLCSYGASATNGSALRVDGGVLRGLL